MFVAAFACWHAFASNVRCQMSDGDDVDGPTVTSDVSDDSDDSHHH